MKILTANFLTCAVKSCKASPLSFPLHFRDAELARQDMEYNPAFLRGILPRIEWDALRVTAAELGFTTLPETKPEAPAQPESLEGPRKLEAENESTASVEVEGMENEADAAEETPKSTTDDEKLMQDLHKLLLETQVMEGKLVCGNCGHEYKIKEGIANFLLPNHLV